jgi:hypothetical protein
MNPPRVNPSSLRISPAALAIVFGTPLLCAQGVPTSQSIRNLPPPHMLVAPGPSIRPDAKLQSPGRTAAGSCGDADEHRADRAVEEALDRVLDRIEFQDVPFNQVLDYLRAALNVNVQILWPALEAAGIERTRPVTLNLRGLSIAQILRATLDDVGLTDVQLDFEVRRGVLLIATREVLEHELVTCAYPVRDLLVAWAARIRLAQPGVAAGDLADRIGSGGAPPVASGRPPGPGAGPASSPGPRSVAAAPPDESLVLLAEEELTSTLTATVAPDSWQINGGLGSYRVFNGALVVSNSRRVQRQVERLLNDLRAAGAAEGAPPPPMPPPRVP